jgi:hypothetical protein
VGRIASYPARPHLSRPVLLGQRESLTQEPIAASVVSEFFVGKKPNHPVLAVEARLPDDLAGSHPTDGLG